MTENEPAPVDTTTTEESATIPQEPATAVTATGTDFDPTPYLRPIGGRGGSQDYLDVRHRLLWLRRSHPDAEIVTEHIRIDDEIAIFKARVTIHGGGSATGHGSETATDFPDFIEKAETKALGRALNALGYGAQFAEGDDDAAQSARPARPVNRPAPTPTARPTPAPRVTPPAASAAPPSRPTADASEKSAVPLEDYSWTAFWNWARAEGFEKKEDVEALIERPMAGLVPADVRRLIMEKRPGGS